MTELADYVRSRRLKLGLTVAEAARRAGLSTRVWAQIEKAQKTHFRVDTLGRVARGLGEHPARVFEAGGLRYSEPSSRDGASAESERLAQIEGRLARLEEDKEDNRDRLARLEQISRELERVLRAGGEQDDSAAPPDVS